MSSTSSGVCMARVGRALKASCALLLRGRCWRAHVCPCHRARSTACGRNRLLWRSGGSLDRYGGQCSWVARSALQA